MLKPSIGSKLLEKCYNKIKFNYVIANYHNIIATN